MAVTVANGTTWATDFFKGIAFSATDELIVANNNQSAITSAYRWHWTQAAGTNIAVTTPTQAYSIAAGEQDKVLEIASANLLSGSTQLPELLIYSDPIVPLTSTTGQPLAVSMTGPTAIRLYPAPDASYTFQFRYYARPIVFAANTESYQCPANFGVVVRDGIIWQAALFLDDERAPEFGKTFYAGLNQLIEIEKRTMEVRR